MPAQRKSSAGKRPKRKNGDGCFRKRKDGIFEYIVSYGFDLDGNSLRRSFYGTTEKICREKAKEFLKKYDSHEVTLKDYTLKEWLEHWMDIYKKPSVSAGTYETYKYSLDVVYRHKIAGAKLIHIKPIHIMEFFEWLASENEKENKKRYSNHVGKKIKALLNSAFEAAIENDMCLKNPVKGSLKLSSLKVAKEKRTYNDEQMKIITEYARKDRYGYIILIMMYAGLRSGEMRALEWRDVDLCERCIHVRKAIKSGGELGGTKNGLSRTIPIPLNLVNYLKTIPRLSKYVVSEDFKISGNFTKDMLGNRQKAFFRRLNQYLEEKNKLDNVDKNKSSSLIKIKGLSQAQN
ncbi:MAG: tyrosine-type recombinase/integrase [Oscillospiraceae bacterium]|jgi:integrase|nr:tyrosine-type recombinase/integrase [Oscillospiraceae bacterium]